MGASTKRTTITPYGDRILVRRFDAADTTEGGIILPDQSQETQNKGRVVRVGPGKRDRDGNRIGIDVKEGDAVLFTAYGNEGIEVDDDVFVLIREDDIIATMAEE